MYDWNDLRHFLAVARVGSAAEAADLMRVNQSTISRRIDALEDALGAKLFHKNGGGYQLTGLGKDLVPIAERAELEAEAVLCLMLLSGCVTNPLATPASSPSTEALASREEAVAEIRAVEEGWVDAFHRLDYDYLERIIAPEFVIQSYRNGRTSFVSRADWMKNVRTQPKNLRAYEARVLEVLPAGNTAVARVQGRWQGRDFYVTDTWALRNGKWQVIFRHSAPPLVSA